MNIAVIGTGYVGLVTGTCLARDHRVTCVDKDKDKIAALNKGIMPIYEDGLEALVEKCVESGQLKFTSDFKAAVTPADVVFICVGTPSQDNGDSDLRAMWSVVADMRTVEVNHPKIVVMKSTVPVGTNTEVEKEFRRHGLRHAVVSNPEFLREGRAINDFLYPARVIIGSSEPRVAQVIRELYMTIPDYKVLRMTREDAEMVKYASNCMLATKISFINEMANICEVLGGDIGSVCKGMGADPRIGTQFLNPGIGYGGSCFPKDVKALNYQAQRGGYDAEILRATMDVNDSQPRRVANRLFELFNKNLENKKIAIWGGAFKPGTDDIREAPAIDLIYYLTGAGAEVTVYDPKAMDGLQEEFKKHMVKFAVNAYDAAKDANAIVLVTEWQEFTKLNMAMVRKRMRGSLFMDCRNVLASHTMDQHGFNYFCIGNGDEVTRGKV